MRTIAGATSGGSMRTVPIYHAILPNHPHDARGALTYLRGRRGCIRLPLPRHDRTRAAWRSGEKFTGNHLRLRFLVPRDEQPQGGLPLYGDAAGRYPLGPAVIVD